MYNHFGYQKIQQVSENYLTFYRSTICRLGSKNDKVFIICMHESKIVIPRRYVEDLDEHVFGTRVFKIPKDYDSYLKLYYGDNYMTPVVNHSHFPLDTVIYPTETADKVERFLADELKRSEEQADTSN